MIIIKNYSLLKKELNKSLAKYSFKKIDENSNYKVFVRGSIDSKNLLSKINKFVQKDIRKLPIELDGQYIMAIIEKKKNSFFLVNSRTSFYSIFYKINKNALKFSTKLLDFKVKNNLLNNYALYEWLVLGGRNISKETKIIDTYNLLPGEIIHYTNKKINIIDKKYFYYKSTNNIKKLLEKIKYQLNKNINDSIKNNNSNILFGLSGGLDSRIIAGLIKKKFRKKIFTYTYGFKNNFEKIISTMVSHYCNFKKHINIDVSDKNYFQEKKQYLQVGDLNSTFQHNYQISLFNKLSYKYNSNTFMLGCALDQFMGSSFSSIELKKIKNNEQYYIWFKKNFFLFSDKELKKIFNFNFLSYEKKLKKNLLTIISKIKFKDYIDLNDALQFEIRILRWYNKNLCYILGRDKKILAPTYEKNFLDLCFKIPSKHRLNSNARKKLLKSINLKLSDIQDVKTLLPASYEGNLEDIYSNKLKEIENISIKNNIQSSQLPSILYDVNFGKKFTNSFIFKKYLSKVFINLKKKKNRGFIKSEFLKKCIKENIHRKNNTRKVFFLITLAEIISI
jgi:hypothetical protein